MKRPLKGTLLCLPSVHSTLCTLIVLQGELDELEREEFFRLKKVQGNKQKAISQRDEEHKAAATAQVSAAL